MPLCKPARILACHPQNEDSVKTSSRVMWHSGHGYREGCQETARIGRKQSKVGMTWGWILKTKKREEIHRMCACLNTHWKIDTFYLKQHSSRIKGGKKLNLTFGTQQKRWWTLDEAPHAHEFLQSYVGLKFLWVTWKHVLHNIKILTLTCTYLQQPSRGHLLTNIFL